MDPLLLAKSMLVGLAIAAPLGPIGALCISRALAGGFWSGLAGGLGTALADAAYASLAALGFAAFAAALDLVEAPLKLAGGLFMLWLGLRSLRATPAGGPVRLAARDLAGTVGATFVLTVTNPMTILSFVAVFAALGLADQPEPANAATVVAGVFAGSLAWWALLSGGVAIARRRLPETFASWVARGSALVLMLFGLAAIASLALPG